MCDIGGSFIPCWSPRPRPISHCVHIYRWKHISQIFCKECYLRVYFSGIGLQCEWTIYSTLRQELSVFCSTPGGSLVKQKNWTCPRHTHTRTSSYCLKQSHVLTTRHLLKCDCNMTFQYAQMVLKWTVKCRNIAWSVCVSCGRPPSLTSRFYGELTFHHSLYTHVCAYWVDAERQSDNKSMDVTRDISHRIGLRC